MTVPEIFSAIGALLALLGAMTQTEIELEPAWAFQRRVRDLDPEGAKNAKLRSWGEGYRAIGHLSWVSEEKNQQLQTKSSASRGWMIVGLGTAFLFIGALGPLRVDKGEIVYYVVCTVGILASAILATLFVKNATQEGYIEANRMFAVHSGLSREQMEEKLNELDQLSPQYRFRAVLDRFIALTKQPVSFIVHTFSRL